MAEIVVVDCTAHTQARRPYLPGEDAQASADSQVGAAIKADDTARESRTSDADSALSQLIAQAGGAANVRAKLKAVLAGTDTLTPAQRDRLLAAVALYALRDRSDS
jgi:hypothetical protein